MEDKYKDDIIKQLTANGAMGVNALARELSVAPSTLQKYLQRQSYFKQTETKQWDLPERVIGDIKSNTLVLMTDLVTTNIHLLKSQLTEMLQTVENALTPVETLKRGVNNLNAPVASHNGQKIHVQLIRINEMYERLCDVFKKQKANIPEQYHEIIFGFDYVRLVLKEGEEYTNSFLEGEVYELLAGKVQELSEDTLQILKDYQKVA